MLVWWPSEQVSRHLPTKNFNRALHELRDRNPRLYLYHHPSLTYPLSLPSSHHDPRTPDPIPSVARTDASGNGALNVTLRLAPGRGKKRHGAWQPSGISLSKPIAQLIGEGNF